MTFYSGFLGLFQGRFNITNLIEYEINYIRNLIIKGVIILF